MRTGLSCQIVATAGEPASQFESLLRRVGFEYDKSDPLLEPAEGFRPASNAVFMDLSSQSGGHLSEWVSRIDRKSALVIGFGERRDVRAVSLALALGLDDFLPLPLDERSLAKRLDCYRDLLAVRRTLEMRKRTLKEFEDNCGTSTRLPRFSDRSNERKVLLVGRTSQLHVQLSGILGPNRLFFAQTAELARELLEDGTFGVVMFVDQAEAGDLQGFVRRFGESMGRRDFALVLATQRSSAEHAADDRIFHDSGFDDVWQLPAPPEFLRVRLGFWIASSACRAELVGKPDQARYPLAVDNLCQMFNYAFAAEYLAQRSSVLEGAAHLGIVALRVHGLADCNRRWNCAVGNRILALIGTALRDSIRAEDLAARLLGGLFVAVVEVEDEGVLSRIAERIRGRIEHALPTFDGVTAPVHVSSHCLISVAGGWPDLDDVVRLAAEPERSMIPVSA